MIVATAGEAPSTAATVAPYVAALIALLVGIGAPWLSARVARRTVREGLVHQRALANADRLWHKRAAAYEELLMWAGTIRDQWLEESERATKARDPSALRRMAENLALPLPLEARMVAYASGAVYDAQRYFISTLKAAIEESAGLVDMLNRAEVAPGALGDLIELHRAVANRMAQAVSDDLHGAGPEDEGRASGGIGLEF